MVLSHIPTQSGGAWNEYTGMTECSIRPAETKESKYSSKTASQRLPQRMIFQLLRLCSQYVEFQESSTESHVNLFRLVSFFHGNSAFSIKVAKSFVILLCAASKANHHAQLCLALPLPEEHTILLYLIIPYLCKIRLKYFWRVRLS